MENEQKINKDLLSELDNDLLNIDTDYDNAYTITGKLPYSNEQLEELMK